MPNGCSAGDFSAVSQVPNGKPAWEGEMERGSTAGGEVKEYKTLATAAHRRWLRKNNQVRLTDDCGPGKTTRSD